MITGENYSKVAWIFAVMITSGGFTGCATADPTAAEPTTAETSALNANPRISDFAVYAQNSATLRERATVSGGDVGVKNVGTGPFLEPGFELALISGARVDASHNVIGDSVELTNQTTIGDVQTAHLTLTNPVTFAHQYGFPSSMPLLPTAAAASPGSVNVTVNAGQTRTISPGRFAAVVVNVNGKLRLNAGSYDFASVQMANDSRIEILGAVQVHIAGRFAAIDRSHIVAAAGTSLPANSIRFEVSGQNGSTGALAATPKAAVFGNDSEFVGLLLAPNGTIMTGQRSVITGALVARDVYVDIDAHVNFQGGFPAPACVPANCDDQNPCTTDTCTEGVCSHTNVAAGTSCSDGNTCNGAESCDAAGACVAGTAVICAASDACHDVGTCDPATGACSNPAKVDGSSCNDGNACTQLDACVAGICTGTNPIVCVAVDQCHLAGSCDPSNGLCSNPVAPDGVTCDDGDACSLVDACLAGACIGTNPVSCGALDACHDPGTCDPASGTCSNPAKPNGAPCNDGNACTTTDSCDSGTCVGGTPVTCAPPDQCHEPGNCDPASGICTNMAKPNGTACNDDNACTSGDACQSGICVPNAGPQLDDNNPCTIDACDPVSGVTHTPAAEGTSCGAGNQCTGQPPQVCRSGSCVTEAVVVDYGSADYRYVEYAYDAEPANFGDFDFDDSTLPLGAAPFASGGGCQIQQQAKSYWAGNDDILLRRHFTLPAGALKFTMHIAIDNDVQVLLNGVDLTGGFQSHEGCAENNQIVVVAPDSLLQTGDNLLAILARDRGSEAAIDVQVSVQLPSGSTLPVPQVDDGNPCTIDTCDPAAGVVHTPVPAGTSCSDNDACNGVELCDTVGVCLPGTPVDVDDHNFCTVDSCDPAGGITHVPAAAGTPCGESQACDAAGHCGDSDM